MLFDPPFAVAVASWLEALGSVHSLFLILDQPPLEVLCLLDLVDLDDLEDGIVW